MKPSLQVVIACIVASLPLADEAIAQQTPPPLTLQQAVTIALEKNPQRKAALAETRASSADVRGARSSFMPRLSFSETATRGNDPVYVFGTRLRQQRFAAADFALNSLNTPLPIGDFVTRFGGTWNLFDSFSSWHGLERAKLMDQAAAHQLSRTDQEIIFRVINSYYAVLLAAKQVDLGEQSVKTAQAIVDHSQSRFESGIVVESDMLTAKVRLAERQQQLIRTRHDLDLARAQLNVTMGVPDGQSFELSEALADRTLPTPELEESEARALANRPDLKRIASEEAAQRQSVSVAKSAFGPQINAFAGWQLDNPTFLAGGGGNNWLGGIEVKFDIFQGGAKRAELARQRALEEKAIAMKQGATDAVRLEVRRAYYDMDSSRQQIEVARAAIALAQDSLRINQNRYQSGLATITDLLNAEEVALHSQTNYWETVYSFRTSYASLELASGTLNAQSPVVMP